MNSRNVMGEAGTLEVRHSFCGGVAGEDPVFAVGAACRGIGEAGERGQTNNGPQRELIEAWHLPFQCYATIRVESGTRKI